MASAPPLDGSIDTSTHVAPEAIKIEGRSPGQIAWMRIKRDRVALISGAIIILFIVVAVFAPLVVKIEGANPDAQNINLLNTATGGIPLGHFGGISGSHWLGIEPVLGRDIFARIVFGARVSLAIAVLATMVSVILGVTLGMTAGYFGGFVDTMISRIMDLLLAFPQLLFTIALISILTTSNAGSTSAARLTVLVVVIGFFGWPYMGRIVRGQTLSLREREFVDAAKSLGASSRHIIFRQLLPNLWGPILVYTTLLIPTNILAEAALSFLGVGVLPPTSSWGQMINDASNYFSSDLTYLLVPGFAIFIAVLAFNLLGDGLRDALDPRADR